MKVRLVAVSVTLGILVSAVLIARVQSPVNAETEATAPTRVLDTRYGIGARAGLLQPGEVLQLSIDGVHIAGETAVLLNLTAVDAVAPGYVSAWACSRSRPATSVLNFEPGRAIPNMVALEYDGQGLCFSSPVPVHLIGDVTAVTTNGDLRGTAPQRVLDTRDGAPLTAQVEHRLGVTGATGVPGEAAAVAANVTVVDPSGNGYLVVKPCDDPSDASTVNFLSGEVVAHFTLTKLVQGEICLMASVDTHVLVDTFGWIPASSKLQPLHPDRLLDTRTGKGGAKGDLKSGSVTRLQVAGRSGVPAGADGATVNAVAVAPSSFGFVTIWACDQPLPTASTLNVWPGSARSNQATLRLSASGELCIRPVTADGSSLHVVMDAVGYVSESTPGAFTPPPPPPNPWTTSECRVTEILVPTCGAWFGASTASLDGTFDYARGLAEYEAVAQNVPDILHIYKNGPQRFPTDNEIAMAHRPGLQRSLLLYNWKPSSKYNWAQVAQGAADAEIDVIAASIKRYPHKLFLNIYHEPEDNVRNTAGSGRTASDYAAMYRHVVDRLRAQGVDNAVFVWNTMGYYGWWDYLDDLYPGDAYVDWVAYDPYGWSLKQSTLESIVQDVKPNIGWPGYYAWVTARAPGKPVMLAEWGFDVDTYPDPASNLAGAAEAMQARYPMLKAFVYWHDIDSKVNPRIDQQSSKGSSYGAAFRQLANHPYFNAIPPDAAP